MYFVLRYLASIGHDITLLAFSRDSDSAESIDHMREFCDEVHTVPMIRSRTRDSFHLLRSALDRRPFLIARDDVDEMYTKARELARSGSFDAIHADQLWMAQYALAAVAAVAARPRLVLDQHNAMFLIPQRLSESSGSGMQRVLMRRESVLMRQYEQETCNQFDDVVWVTAEDQTAVGLGDLPSGKPRQYVIPICVDPKAQPVIERVSAPHRVTFLGGLHWPPNAAGITWFAREIWPQIRAECPDAILTVIGKSPPIELMGIEGVEITGYVDDPQLYLQQTAVFVVPLLAGGGMRVKILDAWCWGLPIVSTTIGAEGIAYTNGSDLEIADDPAGFALSVVRIWRDRAYAEALSRNGRHTVEERYEWKSIYDQWRVIYEAPNVAASEVDHKGVE